MKKCLMLVLLLGGISLAWAESAEKIAASIAAAGDSQWNLLVSQYKEKDEWTDLTSTTLLLQRFDLYDGKVMLFPKIDFGDFITDKDGKKYYLYGEKKGLNFYVIRYNQEIQDLLYKLNNALGNVSGEYEVLGRIVDAWRWWGNVILMKVVAMRIKGRACIVMENDKPVMIGEKILEDWLAKKADKWTKGIPKSATKVPKGLSPEKVAKWFLYYGSEKKDEKLFIELCSVKEEAVSKEGALSRMGASWWRMITKPERDYYFVRVNTERSTEDRKYFMYQIRIDGKNVGVAKPMSVVKETSGEWRVASF